MTNSKFGNSITFPDKKPTNILEPCWKDWVLPKGKHPKVSLSYSLLALYLQELLRVVVGNVLWGEAISMGHCDRLLYNVMHDSWPMTHPQNNCLVYVLEIPEQKVRRKKQNKKKQKNKNKQ